MHYQLQDRIHNTRRKPAAGCKNTNNNTVLAASAITASVGCGQLLQSSPVRGSLDSIALRILSASSIGRQFSGPVFPAFAVVSPGGDEQSYMGIDVAI